MHPHIRTVSFFIWTLGRAYIVFLLFKCNVKWSRHLWKVVCMQISKAAWCAILHAQAACVQPLHCGLSGTGSGFCFWALAQWSICWECQRAAVNAASWGPSGSGFLYPLQTARAWSCILSLAKSLGCSSCSWDGEAGPKIREERETHLCEEITELPVLLDPKQCYWPKLLNHTRRGRGNL